MRDDDDVADALHAAWIGPGRDPVHDDAVRDAVRVGKPDATEAEVWSALATLRSTARHELERTAVYDAILRTGVHYLVAATCSFLVAVTNNYFWNRVWTFRDRRRGIAAQGVRFFVVSLASLVANLAVLHVLITVGSGKLVAQAIAVVLVTPLNFVGNKLWSFRRYPS